MIQPDKVLYTGKTHTTGGRDGVSRSADGRRAAGRMKIALPADLAIDAEVDLATADDAYFLKARLNVSLPGLERETAQAPADAAHQTCPYSKAIRGNVDVVINLV